MESMQEINKEIEVLRNKSNEMLDAYYKVEEETQEKINKLEEKKQKIYDKFERDVRKLFGVVKVEVYHGDYELKIVFSNKTLFQYNTEKLEYRLIGLKNGMKLKSMYEEVYGEPKECQTFNHIQDALDYSLSNLGPHDTVSITRRR